MQHRASSMAAGLLALAGLISLAAPRGVAADPDKRTPELTTLEGRLEEMRHDMVEMQRQLEETQRQLENSQRQLEKVQRQYEEKRQVAKEHIGGEPGATQAKEEELGLLMEISGNEIPETHDDVPTSALIPAFMLSELKRAFQMGFLIYIPFLVIDMVVASVLLSMGMMMLPPVIISLPFKLLFFVLVDGWGLIVGSLVQSFY